MDERGVRTDPGSMRKSILLLAVLAAAIVLPAAALAHTTSLFHGADVASVKSYPNSPHPARSRSTTASATATTSTRATA